MSVKKNKIVEYLAVTNKKKVVSQILRFLEVWRPVVQFFSTDKTQQ